MNLINTLFGMPLGYIMYACYYILGNYGASIILFTLLTKVIMFPLSLISQKNSIIMIKIKPLVEEIRHKNFGNNVLIAQEQKALYKKEGYSSLMNILPLLLQIPLVLGLINVIYNPLQHLLHLDASLIAQYLQTTAQHLGTTVAELGSGGQLNVLELAQKNPSIFAGFANLDALLGMDMNFLGTNLAQIPTVLSITILYPIFSGLSALLLGMYQNKHNVLQQSQGFFAQWGMTLFLTAFSAFFAYVLPCGIGLYWVAGNLLSIPVLWILNKIYDPKKYLDPSLLTRQPKLSKEEKQKAKTLKKLQNAKQKADKKRFHAYKNKQLVFYSEGSGFYKYFFGFIDYILKNSDITIHYVTSDFNDRIFENTNPRIEKYYVSRIALIQFMMLMDADMVVMTTPDLETYHIKRSLVRKDIEYVYIDHGMTSFHMVFNKGALDHFDTIFCYGPNHIAEVRETEKLYNLPAKKLVKSGFPLLDTMLENAEKLKDHVNNPKIILIAPSWQKDNLLEFCLEQTLRPLLGLGYKVIVRPHPEYIKRFPQKMQKICEDYAADLGELFEIQMDFSSNETVYTADLVITDWSSIANEFAYATKKPALFINTPMKVLNPEYTRYENVPLDISLRNEIGIAVDVEQLENLPQIVNELFAKKEWYKEHITEVVKQNIFDVGYGAVHGSQYMIDTLQAKRAKQQNSNTIVQEESAFNVENFNQALQTYLQNSEGNEESIQSVLSEPLGKDLPEGILVGELLQDILAAIAQNIQEKRETK